MESNMKRMVADIPIDLFKRIKSEAIVQNITMRKYILMALVNQLLKDESENK